MSGGTRPRGVLQRRPPTMPDAPGPSPGPGPRLKLRPTVARRLAPLVVVSLAQLMIALDATIVSIALPSAQRALHVSDANRQLVITAYTLAFGGLLLLGGRIADYLGRKRAFLIGLAGFAAASALGGAATNLGMLLAGRALQGAFAAILAPTALSLLAVTFTEPAERARAFAVYGGIAGSGGAAGLLLGGVLTQYLVWRWCLYVNVPIAVIAAAGGWAALPDLRPSGRPRLDIPGALLATGSLAAVVYACTQAVSRRLGCAHRGRPLGGGRGRAGAVRGAGVPLGQPAAAAAHRGRPQPRWRVPGGGPCGRRYVRHVPAAHLLLPGRSAVLARAGGAGVPADDRGGRGQLRSHREPPAAPRAATGHDRSRPAGGRRRAGVARPAPPRQRLRRPCPARRAPDGPGHRLRVRAGLQPRHPRSRPTRRRGRLGDGQHRKPGRRVDRHRAAQHHRRQRHRRLPGRTRARFRHRRRGPGSRPRLHRGHRVGRWHPRGSRAARHHHDQRRPATASWRQRAPTAAHASSRQPDPARHPEAGGSDAGSNGYKTPGRRHPPATETAGADELQLRRRRR